MEFDLYFAELIIVEVSPLCGGFPSTCSYSHFQCVCPKIPEHEHRKGKLVSMAEEKKLACL